MKYLKMIVFLPMLAIYLLGCGLWLAGKWIAQCFREMWGYG